MKLSKIKSTVLVIFTLLVVIFMLVYACTGDLINAVACGAIAILSLMLLVIYLFDDVVVILNNKNFDTHDSNWVINMDDFFVYYKCVDGHCPLVVEEELYGCRTSTCQDYCGGGFCGCNNCWFDGSPYCKDCVHNEKNSSGVRTKLS